ncbi:MAG: hypothetical protein U0X58_00685 [Flavobacteriaceae bacterium]
MVHVPAGSPVSSILPVAEAQVVCVTVPMVYRRCWWLRVMVVEAEAAEGATNRISHCKSITCCSGKSANSISRTRTCNGSRINGPSSRRKSGKFNTSVAVEHVGCVTVPMVGADGVGGCALIVAEADATEVHPEALVTVKV